MSLMLFFWIFFIWYCLTLQCFSAHEIIEAANASEKSITEQQFTDVTNFIILNLLQRKCIKDNDRTRRKLPDGDDFVKDLFKTFGNESHMSHGDFEKFVKALKLGTSNEAKKDEHDTHKRKKRSLVERIKRDVHDGHTAGGDHSNDSHPLLNKVSGRCETLERGLLSWNNCHEETQNKKLIGLRF